MTRLYYLDEQDIRRVVEGLTRKLFPDTPAFQLRGDQGEALLSSALGQPRWQYHRTLQEKAAVLHFHLNRDHPYTDGNKRLATAAMETFLVMNRGALLATDRELTDISLGVARGDVERDELAGFLRMRVVRVYWSAPQILRWAASLPVDELIAVGEASQTDEVQTRRRRFMSQLRSVVDDLG